MIRISRVFVILFVLGVAGCVTPPSVPMASPGSDADAKKFTPQDGKASLYVAWSGSSSGQPVWFDITLDGKAVGPIMPGTFYLLAVDPGRHVVAASAGPSSSRVNLDARAGKNYFCEVTDKSSGMTVQPRLGVVLFEEMGKLMVRQNKRAQSSRE